jgi:hypothetical protein
MQRRGTVLGVEGVEHPVPSTQYRVPSTEYPGPGLDAPSASGAMAIGWAAMFLGCTGRQGGLAHGGHFWLRCRFLFGT